MRGPRYLTSEQAVAIFIDPAPRKIIAHRFGVSLAAICYIKSGKRWGDVTRQWSEAASVNALLISTACGAIP